MTARRAVVLGGGVAGLRAAFLLLDAGYRVELVEGHRWLGGRAFSVEDERLSALRDNGPHVILGCYDHFRWLLRRCGSEGDFIQEPRLRLSYVERGGRMHRLALSGLPVKLAMPAALLRFSGLRFGEKVRTLRGLVASLRTPPEKWALEEWLVDRLQQGKPRDYFWDPLCRAIMNAEAYEVSARLFFACLKQAFGGSAKRAAIWIPKKPWLEIVGQPAQAQLLKEKATLHLGCAVQGMELQDGRVRSLQLRGGKELQLADNDICVSALPWHALREVLPRGLHQDGMNLEGVPIVSVYFDTGGDLLLPFEDHLVYMVGGDPFHYVYREPEQRRRFVLIAEGCRTFAGQKVEAIEASARESLKAWLPSVQLPDSTVVRVSREARATFLPSPGITETQLRPGPLEDVANLLVCGEWTNTGLPSTLEGAAKSAADCLAAAGIVADA